MGRGESKLRRRERNYNVVSSTRTFQDAAGNTITLDQDLKYGRTIAALSGDDRVAIESWENRRVGESIEYATALDANGQSIGEFSGSSGSVRVPRSAWVGASVVTHNHPRPEGSMGGTFSGADMKNFAKYQCVHRATAVEGTYCIAKTASFDREGFLNHVSKTISKRQGEYETVLRGVNKKYMKGEYASYNDYLKEHHNAFSNMLINIHNDYIAGQKTYGYVYSLEARK